MYCGNKKIYKTKVEAEETARYQEEQNPGLILKVYLCVICLNYHLAKEKLCTN